ncbi:MAG: universal stress protein [Thermodesulfobacteriota bacterium]|nr:universal stress protein [Thermodesulfobacteriota bacterium]
MAYHHLHIYRNTPYGRENLLHSIYFCKKLDLALHVYIPRMKKMLMYFRTGAVEVDLDSSYINHTDTAERNIETILADHNGTASFVTPSAYTGSNLPDIPTDFEFMACPRVISDLSSKIGLGRIGSKVRDILLHAPFPVFIPCQVFKKWRRIVVMFGGSANGVKSMRIGIKAARIAGVPLDVVTIRENDNPESHYQGVIKDRGLWPDLNEVMENWFFFNDGEFAENHFIISHEALIVMGISGHGKLKNIVFGSTAEMIQSIFPNSLVLVGPGCRQDHWH